MGEVPDRLKTALSGRYAIEREIGAGGMATVYLARDLRHDRRVALLLIKLPPRRDSIPQLHQLVVTLNWFDELRALTTEAARN